MKGLIFLGVLVAALLVVGLNPHLAADPIMNWVKQNPKYPSAPELLFDTGRVCQFLTDGDTAIVVYNDLYQQYPTEDAFCAEAMYHCGEIKADSGYIKTKTNKKNTKKKKNNKKNNKKQKTKQK